MKRTRLERAAAIAAKRPRTIDAIARPIRVPPARFDAIIDCLIGLLDERRNSGRK